MSELITPYHQGPSFYNDDGVSIVSIYDVNDVWVLDCFADDAPEILKCINGVTTCNAKESRVLSAMKATKYPADVYVGKDTTVADVIEVVEKFQRQNDELVARLSEISKCCEIAKNTTGWDVINIKLHFALDDLFRAADQSQQSTNGSDGE